MAHITTKESAQFFERVLGCAVDGKMCLSKATVRPAKKAEMPGPPRSRTTACQFPRRAREPFGGRCRAAAPSSVIEEERGQARLRTSPSAAANFLRSRMIERAGGAGTP